LELHDESQECVLYLPNINTNEKHIAYMWHNKQIHRETIKSCNACTKNTKTNREEVSQISCIEKRQNDVWIPKCMQNKTESFMQNECMKQKL
jgi:hypothetical protein